MSGQQAVSRPVLLGLLAAAVRAGRVMEADPHQLAAVLLSWWDSETAASDELHATMLAGLTAEDIAELIQLGQRWPRE